VLDPAAPTDTVLLCLAALAAGGLDAIVGGGGLIQLPALLLVLPHQPVVALLGTNKLASVVGTGSAARAYARHAPPDRGVAVPMVVAAFAGAAGGAVVASHVPSSALRPLVLGALVVVLLAVVRRPDLGAVHTSRDRPRVIACAGGFAIGAYDGAIGPGTGTFLVFLLVAGVGLTFLAASATAKLVNTATNLAALLWFAAAGHVYWELGLLMAASNLVGSQIGVRVAVARGSVWVRRVFLFVVTALIARLAYDVLV
jgi:uncharacterized membrane protein YfcA